MKSLVNISLIPLFRFASLCLAWLCAILGALNGDLWLAGVASGLTCALLFNVFKCNEITNKKGSN